MKPFTEYENYQMHLWHLSKDNEYPLYLKFIALCQAVKAGDRGYAIENGKPNQALRGRLLWFVRHVQQNAVDRLTLNQRTRAQIIRDLVAEIAEGGWE